jgi:polar amino acid transport system permease protein
LFDFRLIVESIPLLVKGAVYTVQVSVLAIVFGLVLGWMLGLVAVSGVRWLRAIAWGYVQFIRGTPLLVQIFLIYFGLPTLGINIPAYWSGVIALGLNSAGFQAEIVRAGIESIDRGQTEAARSIGMSSFQTLLFILVPQTIRRVIPPLTNELITLTKSSSLLSVISVYELEKLLHGRHNVRIRRVGLEVDGLLPAAGFVGTLTHRGVTLVRDRDATLQPATTRLTPTTAELRAALGALEGGSSDRVVAQGLVPFVLTDAEDASLSISSEREVSLPEGDLPFDLLPIENYGLTGAWRLEVPDP